MTDTYFQSQIQWLYLKWGDNPHFWEKNNYTDQLSKFDETGTKHEPYCSFTTHQRVTCPSKPINPSVKFVFSANPRLCRSSSQMLRLKSTAAGSERKAWLNKPSSAFRQTDRSIELDTRPLPWNALATQKTPRSHIEGTRPHFPCCL